MTSISITFPGHGTRTEICKVGEELQKFDEFMFALVPQVTSDEGIDRERHYLQVLNPSPLLDLRCEFDRETYLVARVKLENYLRFRGVLDPIPNRDPREQVKIPEPPSKPLLESDMAKVDTGAPASNSDLLGSDPSLEPANNTNPIV